MKINMKKFLTLFLLLCSCAAFAQTEKSKVVSDTLYSNILKCNRAFNVYLPHNYKADADKSYPVLYLLHGYTDDQQMWHKRGHVREVMNNLVRSGQVDEMIIVMPMAGIAKGETETYHGYFNLPDWKYEDFFFQEFIPAVESRYRIKADKQHRAIAGLSMGGGGSTSYGQKHPDMFCAVYAMSALMGRVPGREISSAKDAKQYAMWKSAADNSCVDFVNNASPQTVEQLKSVNWFVDCGDEDFLLDVNFQFIKAMRDKGIPMELRIRDGVHDWEYWHSALYICLPYLDRLFQNR